MKYTEPYSTYVRYTIKYIYIYYIYRISHGNVYTAIKNSIVVKIMYTMNSFNKVSITNRAYEVFMKKKNVH